MELINILGTIVDRNGFDIDGYYCYQDKKTKEYIRTNSMVNGGRFDCNGNSYDLNGKFYSRTNNIYGFSFGKMYIMNGKPSKYDDYGFDYDGINKDTGKIIDLNKFDRDGFFYTFDAEEKKYVKVKPETKVNEYKFDRDGYIWENGIKTSKRRTSDGYDMQGFDVHEFGRDGINKLTGLIVNERNFNQQGFYCIKNKDSTYTVTDRKYDDDGYDIDGLNADGFNKNNLTKTGNEYNKYFFKKDGINIKTGTEWDEHNFNIKGIHKITNKLIDENGFNIDGFYCIVKEDDSIEITEEKYNPEGYNIDGRDKNDFDRNGFYKGEEGNYYNERGFKCDYTYKETGLKYNERYYDFNGINVITKRKLDYRGFNEEGKYLRSGLYTNYDEKGFDVNGINKYTKEKFDKNGYNCYGVDREGKTEKGKVHNYLIASRKYIESVITYGTSMKKWCEANNITEEQFKKILFATGEMYPAIKEELCKMCEKLNNQILENKKINTKEAIIKNMPLRQKLSKAEKIFEIE